MVVESLLGAEELLPEESLSEALVGAELPEALPPEAGEEAELPEGEEAETEALDCLSWPLYKH